MRQITELRVLVMLAFLSIAGYGWGLVISEEPDDKPEERPEKITFKNQSYPEGTTRSINSSFEKEIIGYKKKENQITGAMRQYSSRHKKKTQIILSNKEKQKKFKVTYHKYRTVNDTFQEGVQKKKEPITGHTYKIERTNDGLEISRMDRKEVSPEEKELINDDYDSIKGKSPIKKYLQSRSFRIGKEVTLSEEVMEDFNSYYQQKFPNFTFHSGTMNVVKRTRRQGMDCGVVRFRFDITFEQMNMKLDSRFTSRYVFSTQKMFTLSLTQTLNLKKQTHPVAAGNNKLTIWGTAKRHYRNEISMPESTHKEEKQEKEEKSRPETKSF